MYRELLVKSQQLTPKGTEVERALAQYRHNVSPPYFTTGYVEECPSLKVSASDQEDIIFKHPYETVEEMYPIAEQSQVGTAKKTLIRFDARKSKEFANIVVMNENWKEKVASVCGQVREVLAPGATRVNAEVYKLLIYRQGDFFNRHQDAQYSARMFATLLFFLPVEYSGGEFDMYGPGNLPFGRDVVIEDKKKPNGCSWVAFYTDVGHRVNEVKGGFRVVLNYCLSFEGAMSPSSCLPDMGPSAARVINEYFKEKAFVIPLSHEYTQETLSPVFLKGIDAYIFNAIEKLACPELRFVLKFDKTKLNPPKFTYTYEDDEYDVDVEYNHEQVFQGIFLVKHEIAKKYFAIEIQYERQLAEIDDKDYRSIQNMRDSEYVALMEEVKASQEDLDLEWIVEKEAGNPITNWRAINLQFQHGESAGWLGNMTPAEEYYYLQAAIVVRRKK